MFAITADDIAYHIRECGCCASLKRLQHKGASPKTLEEEINKKHSPLLIAA